MKKITYFIAVFVLIMIISIEAMSLHSYVPVFISQSNEKPIYCVNTDEKVVAISFDAAWGADNTVKILDILDSYNVRATFFLVGFWVDKYPDMVKEIDRRGYEIGNHSENHPEMSKLSTEQMKNELESVNNKINDLIGKRPELFRPPYGDYNNSVINTVRGLDMHAIQWSIDSLDWKEYGREALISRVLKKVKNGDIILFHNNAKYTPEALPEILTELKNRGFKVCAIGDIIYKKDYYVDSRGIQYKYKQ